jgi:hypothetical protein
MAAILEGVGAFVQIIVAVGIVMALFLLAFFVYNKEAIDAAVQKRSIKYVTDIFRGIKDFGTAKNEVYDTLTRDHPTFRNMPASINQAGGAEFTYNFWLYKAGRSGVAASVTKGIEDNLAATDVVLFMRGSNRRTKFANICNLTPGADDQAKNVMIKCPLVKLQGANWDALTIELNTNNAVDGVHETSRNNCGNNSLTNWSKANDHKIGVTGLSDPNYEGKWFMVTIIVSDTEPADLLPLRNKIKIRVYINGILELERYVDNYIGERSAETPSILRQNMGPLYVAPSFSPATATGNGVPFAGTYGVPSNNAKIKLFMANLSYRNYAVTPEEVKSLYAQGFDKKVAPAVNQSDLNTDRYGSTAENKSITDGRPVLRAW